MAATRIVGSRCLTRQARYGVYILAALAAAGLTLRTRVATAQSGKPQGTVQTGGLRAFEIVPLETVSETSSNASIGDLNGDGHPDIVLVKGRHWQVTTRIFLGDGAGHFTPGAASE